MLYLNDIQYDKIYRKQVYLPKATDKDNKKIIKGKGNLIFLMLPTTEEVIEYIKTGRYFKNINNAYISYYADWLIHTKVYNSKMVRYRFSYREQVGKVKSKYPIIKRNYMKVEDYKGSNLFFDMSRYSFIFANSLTKMSELELSREETRLAGNDDKGEATMNESYLEQPLELYDSKNFKIPYQKLSNAYFTFLKNNVFSRDFKDYTNRHLIFPIDEWITAHEVPKNVSEFAPMKVKNIALYIFDWLLTGKFKEVPRMDIIFTCNGSMVKIDSHSDSFSKVLLILIRLMKLKDTVDDRNRLGGTDEGSLPDSMEQQETETVQSVKDKYTDKIVAIYNSKRDVSGFTGETDERVNDTGEEVKTDALAADTDIDEADDEMDEVASKAIDIINKKVDDITTQNSTATPEEIDAAIEGDVDVANAIANMKVEMLKGPSAASLKRDEKLREEFLNKKVLSGKTTVRQILEKKTAPPIETTVIRRDVINKELNNLTVQNFDKTYRENLFEKDIYNVIYAFANDKDIALIPRKITIEDTSDKFNAKETLTVEFEDSLRRRHHFVVDLPRYIDDRFIYLNGSRKIINKQLVLLPIAKTKEDTVQVSSNYKKLFIQRMGTNVSPTLERYKKMLGSFDATGYKVKTGSTLFLNKDYMRTIEYDELSKRFIWINVTKNNPFYINFHIDKMYEELQNRKMYITNDKDKFIPLGILHSSNEAMYINIDSGLVELYSSNGKKRDTNMNLTEFMYKLFEDSFGEKFTKEFGELTVGKKYIYSRVKIMGKFIALALLMAYSESSITKMLDKIQIPYYISETAPKFDNPQERLNNGIIRFKDCYLVYNASKYRNMLLLEGLNEAPLRLYNLGDFDNRDTYLEIFETLLGSKTIANGFDNFKACMTDPITKEILEDLGYPTDYTEILAFANGLLEDNSYKMESDMSLYRLRSEELIPAYLYNTLSEAYGKYRITVANKNPIKVTVPRDKILKDILTAPNVEEYSVLNPILELDKTRTVSFKGLSGLNLEDAYTIDKRTFHPTMLGILGSSTAYSGAVGTSRVMSLDSKIKSARGYLNITDKKDVKELTAKELFTPAESLAPFTVTHDDAPRVLMTSTQAKHMVPVEHTNKLLFGIGTDKVVANIMTDDYSFKAKEDGTVVDINKELDSMVVKYKSGKYDYINIGSEMSKNSSSGFYIDNQLVPNFKKGDKFKAQDILAMNPSYFGEDMIPGQVSYRAGTLAKVAIHSAYFTIEDATGIGEELSEKMATSVVMPKHIVLGPNSNIDFMVNKGDDVLVGDPLIIFDESYDSPEINKMLAKMNDKDSNELNDLGKHKVASKYNANIVDIKVYYTCDFKDLSPSLQKLITKHNGQVNKKKNYAKKYIDDKFTLANKFEPTEKIEQDSRGRVKGIAMDDGVLIEFYLKYRDSLGIGDKITYYTALKGIVSKIIPKDYSAYTEYRPDEPIDAFVGPIGVGARMTTSIETVLLGNKVLIELKRKLKEMAYSK